MAHQYVATSLDGGKDGIIRQTLSLNLLMCIGSYTPLLTAPALSYKLFKITAVLAIIIAQ
jgi:hypothetical protein